MRRLLVSALAIAVCAMGVPGATPARQGPRQRDPREKPNAVGWLGVKEVEGLFECRRVDDTDIDVPSYRELRRSELVSTVRFRLEPNGEYSWNAAQAKADGTYAYRMTYRSPHRSVTSSENGSFSQAVTDIHFDVDARQGTWRLSAGGQLPQPYQRASVAFISEDGKPDETRNESIESRAYAHGLVRGTLANQNPGPLAGTWNYRNYSPNDRTTSTYNARVVLMPVYEDLEVVVKLEGIDDSGKPAEFARWLPRGTRDGGPGATMKATARLQKRNGSSPTMKPTRFRFELHDTSHEPGVAMNWPNIMAQGDPDRPPPDKPADLRFDPRNGQADEPRQQLTVPPRDDSGKPSAESFIQSFDFGAWADLVVVAELPDGREISGHLEGDPGAAVMAIPKRTRPSFIADAWKEQYGVAGADSSDDETQPAGEPGCNGDGLTLYEEYRGFFEGGRHIRTNPRKKDLFIFNQPGAVSLPGIGLFERLSGLEVHKGLLPSSDYGESSERSTDVKGPKVPIGGDGKSTYQPLDHTVINGYFDRGPHRVMQHFIRIRPAGTTRPGGLTIPIRKVYGAPDYHYRPKDVDNVQIDPPREKFWREQYGVAEADTPQLHDRAVAHELFHAVGVDHHGEGDWRFKVQAYGARDPDNKTGHAAWLMWDNGRAIPITLLDESTGKDVSETWASTALGLVGGAEPGISTSESRWWFVQVYHVGVPHGEHSGDEDCVMRYWLADVYPKTGAVNTYYIVADGTEPVGAQLCIRTTGHVVNQSPPPATQKQPRYFDATSGAGKCKYWVCVNDAIPARPSATSGGGL